MSRDHATILPGLLALRRRKLGIPARPEDHAAIEALLSTVEARCARRFLVGDRREPARPADCEEIAGDVLVRLVANPEKPLAAASQGPRAALCAPEATLGDLSDEHALAAELVAASYIRTMLYHRTVELLRKRSERTLSPSNGYDVSEIIEAIEDPATTPEASARSERIADLAHYRQALDAVAAVAVARRALKDLGASYAQLWRLADDETTIEALTLATGLTGPALHQRHKRARVALLETLREEDARGAIDASLVAPLTLIVTLHLTRRQIQERRRVSQGEASTEEPAP